LHNSRARAKCGSPGKGCSITMDWSHFFSQGGYAFYVWGSYLVALLLIGGEVAFLLYRKRSLKRSYDGSLKSEYE
jgi:heme exporter protein D